MIYWTSLQKRKETVRLVPLHTGGTTDCTRLNRTHCRNIPLWEISMGIPMMVYSELLFVKSIINHSLINIKFQTPFLAVSVIPFFNQSVPLFYWYMYLYDKLYSTNQSNILDYTVCPHWKCALIFYLGCALIFPFGQTCGISVVSSVNRFSFLLPDAVFCPRNWWAFFGW